MGDDVTDAQGSEKRFRKYIERGNCHWQEEYGSWMQFNLVQHSRFLAALKYVPSSCKRLLDWGCGDGALSRYLLDRCDSFIGTDTEREGLDFFEQNLTQYRNKYKLIHLQGDLYHVNEPDHSFDCIVCSDVIEHVQSPGRLIEEFARLLSKDGVLIITTPYRSSEIPNDPMHVHEFYPGELSRLLADHFVNTSVHLYQKMLYFSLYTVQWHSRPVIRYVMNILYKLFGYNPLLQDESLKNKWDLYSLIVTVSRH